MRLRLVVCGVATSLILSTGLTASVSAAPIRECGDTQSVQNVTARNVSCFRARNHAGSMESYGSGSGTVMHRGYRCRVRSRNGGPATEFHDVMILDVRCTRGSRVIRWQTSFG